ncbi:MAG: Uma2 family endonuclease [Gammaproteobacteria bacterium]
MSVVNPNVRFTYEDYKSLPESMEKRYELLDGDIRMVPAPTTGHQLASQNLNYLLSQFVRQRKLGIVFYAPLDVVLGDGEHREVVQPDLMFISNGRRHIIAGQEIQGAPDWVIEILSPGTEERDRGYKKSLYARYGVREYWIVDPKERLADVYVLDSQGLGLENRYQSGDLITSRLLPELAVDVDEIFREA